MVRHLMNLRPQPFASIKSGSKTVEMRLFDDRRKAIKVDDVITFTNTQTLEQLSVKVVDVKIFANFHQLYKNFDKIAIGYSATDNAHPDDMLEYYTAEQISTYGVVAICIQRI